MSIAIDIIIIAILFLFTYIGYRRGLVKVVISFISLFIALILTFILYKPVANYVMSTTSLDENINEVIYSKIENIDFNDIDDENHLYTYFEHIIKGSKDATASVVADSLTVTLVEGICFLSIFAIIKLILLVLNLLSDFITDLPLINQFNKSGGLVCGIIKGIIFVFVVFAVVYLVVPLCDSNNIINYINNSYLGNFFYNHNFIVNSLLK